MSPRSVALATTVALLGLVTAVPAVAQPPPGACLTQTKTHDLLPAQPWEDKLLDLSRVWSVTRGAGVRVGVVDSGVDNDNPQLRGKVFPGWDFVRGQAGAQFDCAPHGTAVASIIVGGPLAGTGFTGMAPDARVIPARITDTDQIQGGPQIVADAIKYTVDNGATVLNLSLTVFEDDPEIKQAIQYAQAHDVLVVAAAGNLHQQGNPTPFPAAYPGVLGVGSIDINGALASDSETGDFVKLVAPGVKVTGCDPEQGQELWDGTSFATAFVAGTAALVRAAWPNLTAAQVADRLIDTADVARGGAGSFEYGAGVIDPYRAVTDTTVDGAGPTAARAPIAPPGPDPAARQRAAAAAANGQAVDAALALLGVTVGGLAVAGLVVLGRRRRKPSP
ncbi:MAG TPA: type VII secretion-associated serine protease mycosin [Pseudonocardiaceae bacterium]|nr:type VII secretion-associated serine protease mycosin [Pseudonocardiaceae bacterium]